MKTVNCPFNFLTPNNESRAQSSYALQDILELQEILMIFQPQMNNNVQYYFIDAGGPGVAPNQQPGGNLIGSDQSSTPYYSGDGMIYTVPFHYEPKNNPMFLKMYAVNQTGLYFNCVAVAVLVQR
jgi:hypothetical protein